MRLVYPKHGKEANTLLIEGIRHGKPGGLVISPPLYVYDDTNHYLPEVARRCYMENNKSHYFYVLLCAHNTFYGGYTTDPVRRLAEHNDGIGAKYTRIRSRRPMKMIYTEAFTTRSEAMRRRVRL